MKIGRVKGAHDIIILSSFGLNIFRGFRSTGGQNLHVPIDFAGHRYNSAATTAHRVPTGQGKLEKSEFEWSGKIRERSGKNIFWKSQGK